MSNKKQSSIEWLLQELTYDNGFGQRCISFTETVDLTPYFEQAKAMYEQEIVNTWTEATAPTHEICLSDTTYILAQIKKAEQYYNETYGGNNE